MQGVRHDFARARTAVLSVALIVASLAAHAAAGGGLPGLAGLAAVGALATAFATMFGRTRHGIGAVIAFSLLAQLALHGVASLTSAHGHAGLLPSTTMLTAHLLAAGVIALVVTRGEALALRLMMLVGALLGARVSADAPHCARQVLRSAAAPPVLRHLVRSCLCLRGPPVLPASSL